MKSQVVTYQTPVGDHETEGLFFYGGSTKPRVSMLRWSDFGWFGLPYRNSEFTHLKIEIFHSFLYVYQRVSANSLLDPTASHGSTTFHAPLLQVMQVTPPRHPSHWRRLMQGFLPSLRSCRWEVHHDLLRKPQLPKPGSTLKFEKMEVGQLEFELVPFRKQF